MNKLRQSNDIRSSENEQLRPSNVTRPVQAARALKNISIVMTKSIHISKTYIGEHGVERDTKSKTIFVN